MTKTDFIETLDFEVAKSSIAKKLGMKADDLTIRHTKSGDFKINLKNVSGKMSPLFYGASKAVLVTDKLNIKEHKDTFSYEAVVSLDLKNTTGEYKNRIGKLNLNNNRFVFYTNNDIKQAKQKKNEKEPVVKAV
ncbi:MAG: hypothetical protein IJZ36_00595 [Bacilli bacterium]|nr:hypothetical protein [Bacilli bacterium]